MAGDVGQPTIVWTMSGSVAIGSAFACEIGREARVFRLSTIKGKGTRDVAVFDLDGTITRGDTLFPFLQRVCGITEFARSILQGSPSLGLALVGLADRDKAKAALLRAALAGRSVAEVDLVATRFADWLVASELRPEILSRIEWHRGHGHELVLASASLEIYVGHLGSRLAFDAVLATRLEANPDGRFTGALIGANVRGAEKARRLRDHLSGRDAIVWAYGNSAGDREMLSLATYPTVVGSHGLRGLRPRPDE